MTFVEAINRGISVFPVYKSKIPAVSWKKYQTEIATIEEAQLWDNGDYLIGVCCGSISGNLQVLDVDEKNNTIGSVPLIKQWSDKVKDIDPELLSKVTLQPTPSGGWHVAYRTQEAPKGNQRYASRHKLPSEDASERQMVLLESRAEGGYIRYYGVVEGKKQLWELEPLTPDEVETIESCARQLNDVFYEPKERKEHSKTLGNSPLDLYDAECDSTVTLALLLEYGWSITRDMGDSWQLARPGKRSGVSATLNVIPDRFYVFTSSSEFEPENTYKHSAVLVMLKYDGDYSACARDLAKQGYIDTTTKDEAQEMLDKLLNKEKFTIEGDSEEERAILSRVVTSKQAMDNYLSFVATKRDFRLGREFRELEAIMKDINPSHTVGWAAASSVGKTTSVRQVFNSYLNETDQWGMFASLELLNRDIALRDAMEMSDPHNEDGYVDKDIVTKDLLSNKQFREAVIENGSRFLTLDSAYSIEVIFQIAAVLSNKLAREGKKLSVVVIDFLQLADKGHDINFQPELAQLCKLHAKKLDTIVVPLLQMNSTVGKFEEPQDNNISGHKALFQTLDHGFMLWKSPVDKKRIVIKSGKQRWSLEARCDLVQTGMKMRSEPHQEITRDAIAKTLGCKGL